MEIEIIEHFLPLTVRKTDLIEDEAVANWARRGQGMGFRVELRFHPQKLYQVGEKQGMLGDIRKRREDVLHVAAGAGDCTCQKLQGAPTHRAIYSTKYY